MKLVFRVLHYLLVLVLSALLMRIVYYGFTLLRTEQYPRSRLAAHPEERHVAGPRKPSPQEIAASMNTLWDTWDEEHCRNVCEASWIACRLRQCDGLPDVRKQEL